MRRGVSYGLLPYSFLKQYCVSDDVTLDIQAYVPIAISHQNDSHNNILNFVMPYADTSCVLLPKQLYVHLYH
jgi:hypothetical protein